jgi:hypothetical protein
VNRVSDSSKIPGSDSGKKSGTILDKGPGKHPGKNSDKEAGQDKTCKTNCASQNVQDKEISLIWSQCE